MTHCRLVHSCRRFGKFPVPFSESKQSRTNLHSWYFTSTLKMATISNSGMSVTVDRSPCRHILVDMKRHGHHFENVKFDIMIACYHISKLCMIRTLTQKCLLINIVLYRAIGDWRHLCLKERSCLITVPLRRLASSCLCCQEAVYVLPRYKKRCWK